MGTVIKEQRSCWIPKRQMRWEQGGRSNSSFKTKSKELRICRKADGMYEGYQGTISVFVAAYSLRSWYICCPFNTMPQLSLERLN